MRTRNVLLPLPSKDASRIANASCARVAPRLRAHSGSHSGELAGPKQVSKCVPPPLPTFTRSVASFACTFGHTWSRHEGAGADTLASLCVLPPTPLRRRLLSCARAKKSIRESARGRCGARNHPTARNGRRGSARHRWPKLRINCTSCATLCEVQIPAQVKKSVRFQIKCPRCQTLNELRSPAPVADGAAGSKRRVTRLQRVLLQKGGRQRRLLLRGSCARLPRACARSSSAQRAAVGWIQDSRRADGWQRAGRVLCRGPQRDERSEWLLDAAICH